MKSLNLTNTPTSPPVNLLDLYSSRDDSSSNLVSSLLLGIGLLVFVCCMVGFIYVLKLKKCWSDSSEVVPGNFPEDVEMAQNDRVVEQQEFRNGNAIGFSLGRHIVVAGGQVLRVEVAVVEQQESPNGNARGHSLVRHKLVAVVEQQEPRNDNAGGLPLGRHILVADVEMLAEGLEPAAPFGE